MSKKDADLKAEALEELGNEESSRTLKKSLQFVSRKELPLPRKWSSEELENLDFPEDVTKLSSDELGKLMGLWTSVMGYTQFEAAKADIEMIAKQNKLQYEQKILTLRMLEEKGLTETQKKARVETDSEIIKLKTQYEFARAKHRLVDAMLKIYGRYYNVLSRELSRRGQEPFEPSESRVRKGTRRDEEEDEGFEKEIEERKGSLAKEFSRKRGD